MTEQTKQCPLDEKSDFFRDVFKLQNFATFQCPHMANDIKFVSLEYGRKGGLGDTHVWLVMLRYNLDNRICNNCIYGSGLIQIT